MGGSPNQQFVDCCDFVVQFLFLSFRLFFFFFFIAHFSNRMKNKGGWGWPENGCRLQSPEFRGIFVFEKHAWFKWYPCNLIALFVNDICYARIISPWPVVPFFFLFFFPEMELESLEFRWMKRFFFFFDTSFREFGDSILQHGPLSRIMTKFFFFSFVTGKSNRAIGWQSMVNICPKKKELKKKYCKIIVSI